MEAGLPQNRVSKAKATRDNTFLDENELTTEDFIYFLILLLHSGLARVPEQSLL